MKAYINPNVLIELRNTQIYLIYLENANNYVENAEVALTLKDLKRIFKIKANPQTKLSKLDEILVKMDLIYLKRSKTKIWPWGPVSRIFHFGTKNVFLKAPSNQARQKQFDLIYEKVKGKLFEIEHVSFLPLKTYNLPIISLPPSQHKKLLQKSFFYVLEKERKEKKLTLSILSTLLFTCFSIIEDTPENNLEPKLTKRELHRRTSPSGGSFQSSTPYVWINKVDGLETGLYFYDGLNHQLKMIRKGNFSKKISGYLFRNEEFSAGIFLTTQFIRKASKYYYSRTYRVLLLDVGHLSQTFHWVSKALEINSTPISLFRDSPIEKLIKINLDHEQILFSFAIK